MKSNFDVAFSSNVIKNGKTNWFKNISATITHLKNDYNIKHELLQKYVIHHMIDEITFNEKLKFIEHIYNTDKSDIITITAKIFDDMIIQTSDKKLKALVLAKNNTESVIYVNKDKKWVEAEYTDLTKLQNSESKVTYPNNTVFGLYLGLMTDLILKLEI